MAGVRIPGNDDTLSGSEDGWASMTGQGGECDGSWSAGIITRSRSFLAQSLASMNRHHPFHWHGRTSTFVFRIRLGETRLCACVLYCQALVPYPLSPNPKAQPSQTQFKGPISSKGTGADTKILWATTPPTHNFYA